MTKTLKRQKGKTLGHTEPCSLKITAKWFLVLADAEKKDTESKKDIEFLDAINAESKILSSISQ